MSDSKPTAADRLKAATVSSLGLGYAPVASGTFGTLGALIPIACLYPFRDQIHFGVAMVVLIVLGMAVGVALGGWAERFYGKKDPGHFVLDELVGYWVTVLRLGDGFPGWKELAVAFFAFRLFDVIKPWPGRRLEHMTRGWGIMLDDVIAGIYALMLVSVLRTYLEWQ